ncbi:TetR/AcrR family transcriptional regulator [Mycolicibacterium arenosum]|uniref:TetR/AcrR family transcriptional regulator n=1 Tax=Mycolicibacterium arenosum TaxID=2952157 RepID=A0ABT1MAA0_9MYCO|nr:TetR/AcrR family transcriptional regulator [Mycolicibacterium sp. CAU 1645]MCP9275767.1 TetR/AcrR family transcriptional regulator [Mycolicibacterium sp. CAU 1645]
MSTANPARTARGRRTARPSGDDREAAILETAAKLLEDKKFVDISVDDLAKGAGLSRPTFYFYFPSKEAVLLSLIDPLIKRADGGFDGAMEHLPTDPRRAFRAGIAIFFEAFADSPVMARAATDALTTNAELRTWWATFMQKWIHQTAALIASERDRGAAPTTIPALDLATSLNLMNERVMIATLADEEGAVQREQVVDTLTHIWLASIYGQSG